MKPPPIFCVRSVNLTFIQLPEISSALNESLPRGTIVGLHRIVIVLHFDTTLHPPTHTHTQQPLLLLCLMFSSFFHRLLRRFTWRTTEWSDCRIDLLLSQQDRRRGNLTGLCGGGLQTREVYCVQANAELLQYLSDLREKDKGEKNDTAAVGPTV